MGTTIKEPFKLLRLFLIILFPFLIESQTFIIYNLIDNTQTCADPTCRKDLYGGQYVYCATSPGISNIQNIETPLECASYCYNEPNCNYFTVYDFGSGYGACNLFIPMNP